MSPPVDSQGPTEEMTRTLFGPHFSKASYSGDSMPAGLSAAMSGRCGTMRSVTARPASKRHSRRQSWDAGFAQGVLETLVPCLCLLCHSLLSF